MWIKTVTLKNIKGFVNSGNIEFSKRINILIGHNNSGKSTIINTINYLQETPAPFLENTEYQLVPTIGSQQGFVAIELGDIEIYKSMLLSYREKPHIIASSVIEHYRAYLHPNVLMDVPRIQQPNGYNLRVNTGSTPQQKLNRFPNKEPINIIYPFLAKRKLSRIQYNVHEENIKAVLGNFDNLISKIDSLCALNHPEHKVYMDTCKQVLGFEVTTRYQNSNKIAGLYVDEDSFIQITSMGEGVMHLLALIVSLCVAKNHIFLIEELENDIHPKALKVLLSLIEKSSENNQFIISTHSNVVTKFLGGVSGTKLFEVKMEIKNGIPSSIIRDVPDSKIERLRVLEDLGYDFFDFDLWKGWLFLEEATAETIIRDFLIPTFTPVIQGQIKTFSAAGAGAIKPKFNDFNRLYVFLHLEPLYKDKAWVIIDAGEREKIIIEELKNKYVKGNGWSESRFKQFSRGMFEEYYPERFQINVNDIKTEKNPDILKNKKTALVKKVLEWTKECPKAAKEEFQVSASEVINILESISNEV